MVSNGPITHMPLKIKHSPTEGGTKQTNDIIIHSVQHKRTDIICHDIKEAKNAEIHTKQSNEVCMAKSLDADTYPSKVSFFDDSKNVVMKIG